MFSPIIEPRYLHLQQMGVFVHYELHQTLLLKKAMIYTHQPSTFSAQLIHTYDGYYEWATIYYRLITNVR